MAQGHWGRPEEPQRGRDDPPTHTGEGPPQWVAEAVTEEEVRGGGEVQQGGKLGWWGQGLGLGLGLCTEAWPFCHFRAYTLQKRGQMGLVRYPETSSLYRTARFWGWGLAPWEPRPQAGQELPLTLVALPTSCSLLHRGSVAAWPRP